MRLRATPARPTVARAGLEALSARSPQAIVESLVTGAMRAQGARLSGAERRAVAEFLTGRTIAGDVRGADTGRCTRADSPAADRARAPRWTGWSPAVTNTRVADGGRRGPDAPRTCRGSR